MRGVDALLKISIDDYWESMRIERHQLKRQELSVVIYTTVSSNTIHTI